MQFGIPNSRLRYYLIAKKTAKTDSFLHTNRSDGAELERVWRHIPGHGQDWVDPRDLKNVDGSSTFSSVAFRVRDVLDSEADISLKYGPGELPFIKDKVLQRWGRLFDIVLPSATRTCCFTRGVCTFGLNGSHDHGVECLIFGFEVILRWLSALGQLCSSTKSWM
jgi:tRNA (cytosine38-C5)-methyltransferase